MFVNLEKIPVTVEGNTIYIRNRMDFATRNRVLEAFVNYEDGNTKVSPYLYLTALAQANILGWEGPAFTGVECTPVNIAKLDPDDPLVEAVMDEIARRNPLKGKTAAEKKSDMNGGAPS